MFNPMAATLRKVEEASRRATVRYQPKPYPGRVTLFRASKQPAGIYPDPELGWTAIASGGVEVHEVPGHHGAIVYEPRIGTLAQHLARCLEEAYQQATSSSISSGAR
jgi:thioesterase domain-containing protein